MKSNKFVEDLIYKNLETPVLLEMKLKIEQELLDRRMKDECPKEEDIKFVKNL